MALTPRDVKDVSALVAKKLELYMNHERREDRFDPQGRYRTTPKMQTLDLMYHMLDTADLKKRESKSSRSGSPHKDGKDTRSRKNKRRVKSSHKDDSSSDARNGIEEDRSGSERRKSEAKEKKKTIKPHLVHNSRRVVALREAERLTETANKILEQQDLDKLQVIHRYRPHSPDVAPITENGRVANYSLHVGSALHSKDYVDYYMKEGLQSSKKEYAKRLQRLQKKRERERDAESHQDAKGCNETSSASVGQNHQPTSTLRMQEILNPRHSAESLSSSRSSTPRKLNPLTIEQPKYNAFTNMSQSSRGSNEKTSKASSQLYKAKRYANGYGYRIIAENDKMDSPRYQSVGSESRADVASCEEYCKFSGSQAEVQESSSGREGFGSEVDGKKVLEATNIDLEYKKYKSISTDSISMSKEKEESEDTRAPTHNESFVSGSHLSARSTTSHYSRQSKDFDRSYQSNHSMMSSTYRTQESDMYNTTQSEHDLDSVKSTSILSSTPRRRRIKRGKQEPIQTIINPPEVPRLGLPSEADETTARVSSLNSSAVEDYLTADEKAQKHPDARALDNRVNSSQDRARDRTLNNDDTRAERSLQKFLGSDEIPVESVPPIDHLVSPKVDGNEKIENVTEKKVSEGDKADGESKISKKNLIDNDLKLELDGQSGENSVSHTESDTVIDCQDSGSQVKRVPSRRRRANEVEGKEGERGEDEMKNMEFHRGEVPLADKTKVKVKPERGDDTPRSMAAKGRLTKSAKRRGDSNYYTKGEEERGLEKEYFEPVFQDEKETYIPAYEEGKESELNTPASSRPSSASSISSNGTHQSGGSKKKGKANLAPIESNQSQEREKGSRPPSAASKSVDGRGDDSHSVKLKAQRKSKTEEKETQGSASQGDGANDKGSVSLGSHASYGKDTHDEKLQASVGSRGSITTKERLGTGKGYSIEGEMLSRGQDQRSEGKNHNAGALNKANEEKPQQNLTDVKNVSEIKEKSIGEMPSKQESIRDIDLVQGSFEKSKAESLIERQSQAVLHIENQLQTESQIEAPAQAELQAKTPIESNEAPGQEKENEVLGNTEQHKNESQFKNSQMESSDIIKKEADPKEEKDLSSESLKNVTEQFIGDEAQAESEKDSENKMSSPSANQEMPLEDKAFIEADSVDNEVIKEAVSSSASLLQGDGDTVIDFRPLSASTAISVGNDYDDHKRLSLPQPAKIVEVTEVESNMGSGRDTRRTSKDPIIPHPAEVKRSDIPHTAEAKEVNMDTSHTSDMDEGKKSDIPHPAEVKQSKQRENKAHVVNIADVKLESYEQIKEHPAMKRSSSDYWSLKEKEKKDHQARNVSLPLDHKTGGAAETTPATQSEDVKKEDTPGADCEEAINGIPNVVSNDNHLVGKSAEKDLPEPQKTTQGNMSRPIEILEKAEYEGEKAKESEEVSDKIQIENQKTMNEASLEPAKANERTSEREKLNDKPSSDQEKKTDDTPSEQEKVTYKTPSGQEKLANNIGKTVEDKNMVEIGNGLDKVKETSLNEQRKVDEAPSIEQEEAPFVQGIVTKINPYEQQTENDGDFSDKPSSTRKHDGDISQTLTERKSIVQDISSEQVQVKAKLVTEQEKPISEQRKEEEKGKEQPSVEQEKPKEQPSVEQEKPKKQHSIEKEIPKEQHSIEQEKSIEQHSIEQEKPKEQHSIEKEKRNEQHSIEQEKAKEQPSIEQERRKEQHSIEQEKPKEQHLIEQENTKEQHSTEQERPKEQHSIEQEKTNEQPSIQQEKPKEQPSVEQEKPKEQHSVEQEKPKEQHLIEEKPKEQHSIEQGRPKEQPSVEEKSKEQPSVEQEKPKEQHLIEEKPKEQHSVEQEKPKEQPSIEQANPKEQPSFEEKPKEQPSVEEKPKEQPSVEEKPKEQPSVEQEHPKEQPAVEEKPKEQPSVEQEKPKEQPSVEQEKPKEQPSIEQEKPKEQHLIEEKPKEQHSVEQEKSKEQHSVEQEKSKEQYLIEEKPKEQPSIQQEKAKEQPSVEQERPKEQHSVEQEKAKEQSSVKQEMPKKQHSVEQEKPKEQPSVEQEKPKEQPSVEQEKPKEQPSIEQEKPKKQPSVEPEKPKEQPSIQQEKPKEQPSVEQERPKEQHSVEQEKPKEQPSIQQEKAKEQHSFEQEKANEQHSVEQERQKEQHSVEQKKTKEQSSVKQEMPKKQHSIEEKPKEQPSYEQEKPKEQPSVEQEKPKEQPSVEQEKPKEQLIVEQEKPKKQPSVEQEKPKEQLIVEQEKPKEQPSVEQEKPKEQPLVEQEKPKEQSSVEQEKPKEQPLVEQEKPKEQLIVEQEKPKEQPSVEQEKPKEQLIVEQEKPKEQPPVEQEKPKEQLIVEQEKPKEQPSVEQEKPKEQPLVEQEKPKEQSSVEQEKPKEQPLVEQEKPKEQPSVEQEKPKEQPSVEQEKPKEQPSVEQEKPKEQHSTEEKPKEQLSTEEQPLVEQEKV